MGNNFTDKWISWGDLRHQNTADPTDADHIQHMLQATEQLATLLGPVSLTQYLADEECKGAACRAFASLGTAANAVTAIIKKEYAAIAWRQWTNYGRLLVRRCDSVNHQLLWQKWQQELPALREQLLALEAEWFDKAN